jgi:isopentenyl-diphosphate delta-isomerase
MVEIILVNKKDQEIGSEDKLKVHKLGLLHRSFSIFIFNSKGKLLIQRRAKNKYHSGGLWSNTCCSHQRPNELLNKAVHQRLTEEMDIDCDLRESFSFLYNVKLDHGLIENEFDHVFIGVCDKKPKPNPKEVSDFKYISIKELKKDIKDNPNNYTEWFKIIIKKYLLNLTTKKSDESLKYWNKSKEVSKELNIFFEKFCKDNQEFDLIKDLYLAKQIHLNGVQFYGGFIAGSKKDWKKYLIIPIIIELIMIWAYKTNQIIDDKKLVWENKESIKNTVLKHDLLLSLIFELLGLSKKILKTKFDLFDYLVKEMMVGMTRGFFIEKYQLNVNFSNLKKILKNWDQKYAERNINFNLVYDHSPLIGFWLATDDEGIFKKYSQHFTVNKRFSEIGQTVNDMGDWMQTFDTNVRVYQDQFADIRNGIVTWPVYKSIKNKDILSALKNPSITLRKDWQKRVLLLKPRLSIELKKVSKKCFNDLSDFWSKYKRTDDDFVIKTYLLLKHNKYLK